MIVPANMGAKMLVLLHDFALLANFTSFLEEHRIRSRNAIL